MASSKPNKAATNPFAGSSDEDDEIPPEEGPTAVAAPANNASVAASGGASSNPFDFDVDFSQVQKRRERARAAKESAKEEAEKPILSAVDEDDNNKNHAAAVSPVKGAAGGGGGGAASGGARRPNLITQRAKTMGDVPLTGAGMMQQMQNQQQQRRGFFGFNKAKDLQPIDVIEEDEPLYCGPLFVGKRKLAVWPYDDYHLVQKLYYEKLDDSSSNATASETKAESSSSSSSSYSEPSTAPMFRRPPDPVDIPTAVQGLSLTEFEAKAEERAISIVSTWLFDAGLIDELLVHGGMALGGGRYPNTNGGRRTSSSSRNRQGPSDNDSVPSQEGVEVGQHGVIENKMDKEIAKLRASTNRQLALINARLNDGVAATGSEVQELVHAVIATKDDISRLRELSTYIRNTGDVDDANQFLLTKYPRLKQAINARRNLARCFRELDFFAQIPSTCDRLREELQSCEWTTHEWSTLRSVCREHVELEIFLVEAEAGMKKRLDEEEEAANNVTAASTKQSRKSRNKKFGRQAFTNTGLRRDHELIDKFLQEHVQNVWELGDEIRMRIMSGIASSFELAINNPAGMVALCEAVEVYQSANDDYKTVHGVEAGKSQNLRFTDMRAAGLGELYKDFETRGLDIFRELTMQAADVAEEEEASNRQFSAVLRAANELASEIGVVRDRVVPCFPPNWYLEILWTTCVAHVCSNNILQQIGGPEGHKLPDLTVTQLLDLVAWVETFREIIQESFPNIVNITHSKTYLDKPPQLLVDDGKKVDVEVAKDSLAWVNKTLWDVHDLAKDEFLFRTKEQTEEWLNNVYAADHTKTETSEGRLLTSLCEDVFSLAGVQLKTIRERLTRRSEALVQAVGVIFKNLYEKQIACRDQFCTDFETCCAAANDFVRMSEKAEVIVDDIKEECSLSPEAEETLEEQAAVLLGLYSGDAVWAAQKTHMYIFEPIEEAIFDEMFGSEWLNDLTQNEHALTIIRTQDDFLEDLEAFLDEVMVTKAIEAQVSSAVNFYIRALLDKASKHNSSRSSYFADNEKALVRMRGDVQVIRDYFEGLAESMPTLTRPIEKEFDLLEAVLELVSIASGISTSDAQDFILLLHKRVRNFPITKFVVGDLYHLVNPAEEHSIYEVMDGMEQTMAAVVPADDKALSSAQDRSTVPGLRIDQILAMHCDKSKRTRPIQGGALERAEITLKAWRSAFGKQESKD